MPANITSRGTLVRSRWDFYENANAIGYVAASAVVGNAFFFLTNNASAQVNLDIFRIEFCQSASGGVLYQLFPPNFVPGGPLFTAKSLIALDPINSQPTGAIGCTSTFTAPTPIPFRQRVDAVFFDTIELNGSDFFLTLPPLWTLQVAGNPPTAPLQTMTVWFQQVADQIKPAGT